DRPRSRRTPGSPRARPSSARSTSRPACRGPAGWAAPHRGRRRCGRCACPLPAPARPRCRRTGSFAGHAAAGCAQPTGPASAGSGHRRAPERRRDGLARAVEAPELWRPSPLIGLYPSCFSFASIQFFIEVIFWTELGHARRAHWRPNPGRLGKLGSDDQVHPVPKDKSIVQRTVLAFLLGQFAPPDGLPMSHGSCESTRMNLRWMSSCVLLLTACTGDDGGTIYGMEGEENPSTGITVGNDSTDGGQTEAPGDGDGDGSNDEDPGDG